MSRSNHRHRHHHRHDSRGKRITIYTLLVVNCIFVFLMLLSSFSGTLAPQNYPKLSVMPLLFPIFLGINILFLIAWLFIRKKFALVSAIAMLLCITDIRGYFPINIPSNAPPGCIKVMSYNIAYRNLNYISGIIDYISEASPDILCLQECAKSSKLTENPTIRQIYPYIAYDSIKASMVTCMSKYPITHSEIIDYESVGNSSMAHNIVIDKDTILVVNNHFQSYILSKNDIEEYKGITGRHTDMADREKGTKDIARKIIKANKARGPQVEKVYDYLEKHHKRYTIVLGDFNEPAMSYAHYMLTKKYKDAFTRAGNGFGFTYNQNKIHYRIDHILYSDDIDAFETEVDRSCDISDHYPIFTYLKLE